MNDFIMFAAAAAAPAAAEGNAVKQIADTFGWSPQLFFSQVVLFGIVAFVLHKFAYQPILDMLAERKHRIAEGLANAEKIKTELARTEASRQEVLNQANVQANKLIEEARVAAQRVLEQETQKAIAAAESIISKAREATEADRLRIMTELRREVGRLVIETTAKVTGKILTMEDQKRLAEETNRELAA